MHATLTHHMASHIILMNLVAPALALIVVRLQRSPRPVGAVALIAASVLHISLLLLWHAPPGMALAMANTVTTLAMQASLLAVAFAFWSAVFRQVGPHRWRALAALAVTGKIYCLFAALLIFAPRVLYGAGAHEPMMTTAATALADQQLAGLLMVAACPITYVTAAVAISARWFSELCAQAPPPRGPHDAVRNDAGRAA